MKLSPYPKYRPSGVEWLGDVPAHWVTWKATHGFRRIGSGTTPKSDNSAYYDGNIPWVTTSELRETIIAHTTREVTATAMHEYPTLRMYQKGTLLFAMYGATIGRLGILGIAATVNQACAALAEPLHLDTWFVYYWLQMRRPTLIVLSAGGGQPNLSQDDLRQLRIPAPTLDEQRIIAEFLDRETSRLETLVAKKRTLIERLKEKRTALISRTVTRGLPPDVAHAASLVPHPTLKQSGIDWLGDVPAHWEIRRLRQISDAITVGVVVNPSNYVADEGVPFLLGGDVREFNIDTTASKRCLVEVSNGPLLKSRLAAGDLVVVRVGYPGVAAVVPEDLEGANCASMMIVRRQRRFASQWLAYALNSQPGRDQIDLVQYGAAQKQFNISHAVDFTFPFPPLREQCAIADFLDGETEKIDSVVVKIETAMERLQEYRGALVTAAVTGKIDVREAAV